MEESYTRWARRDAKKLAKRRSSSDNRRSVRWLYWYSGQKAIKKRSNEDTLGSMPLL